MNLKLPIVLIGPMGVGKTTVGKKLAHQLNVEFVDTDSLITGKYGPIPVLFEKFGEDHFRLLETEALEIALSQPAVIATGGGVVLLPQNREKLKQSNCIYLSTDGKHQISRLQKGNRPLLKNGIEDWKRIYEERRPLYEEVASHTLDTSNMPLKVIVEQLVKAVR